MQKIKRRNGGFSLVELIIVIAIMAVLIGVLAPQYLGYIKRSKKSVDLQNAENLATAIAVHIADQEAAGNDVAALATNTWREVNTTNLPDFGVTVPAPKLEANRKYFFYYNGGKAVYVAIVPNGTTPSNPAVSGITPATAAAIQASAADYLVYPTIGTGTNNIYNK